MMSSLKVASINHPSASSGGLAIGTDGNVSGAGMDLIVSQSFTAASTVSIDGCFTSEYDNYVVTCSGVHSSAVTEIRIRLRAAASDLSSSTYRFQRTDVNGASVGGASGTAQSSGFFMFMDSAYRNSLSLYVYEPAVAVATAWSGLGTRLDSPGAEVVSGNNSSAAAYDGFTIYPASGTITGTIRVYGYRN